MNKVYDDGFIISGAIQDTNSYVSGFLLKINNNFDCILYKEFLDYDTNHYAEFQQCKQTYDKGFILAGTKTSNVYNAYDQDILIVKTDSMGNEQWRKVINLGGVEYARNVIQTPDKGYLFGCYTYNENYLSGDGVIIKLDSLGNTKWTKTLFGPNQDGVPMLALAKDSNIYVATSYAYHTDFMSFSDLKIQTLKLNKNNGNIIWNRQYDTIRTACYPQMIKVDANDNPIIFGCEFLYNGYNYIGSWILKLKPNGDSVLFRTFHKYNDQYANTNQMSDFILADNNSIVITGYVQQDTSLQYLWLVKMDSLGCLQPGCNQTGIKEIYSHKGELSIFPNPATTQTTITYMQLNKESQLQIYNMLGQLVYEEKLGKDSNQTIIITTGFKPGLYKVVAGENSGTLIVNG